jgi:hypothetical protein
MSMNLIGVTAAAIKVRSMLRRHMGKEKKINMKIRRAKSLEQYSACGLML